MKYTIETPTVRRVLQRLHQEARRDSIRFIKMGVLSFKSLLHGKLPRFKLPPRERAHALRDVYIALTPEEGRFVYLTTRSLRARRVIEFGTSFGVSTIYLAAAVKDNGGGQVIGSEFEETKITVAQTNLTEAELNEYVEIRPGDAMTTLSEIESPVDLVLMDGWKEMYVSLIKLLSPKLRPGAVVIAADIHKFKKALAPYVAYMQDIAYGFQSSVLPIGGGMLYSVKL